MHKALKELDKLYKGYENEMLDNEEVEKIMSRLSLGKLSNVRTVLLVDDAAFMRKVEREILTENGYIVIAEAENGLESVQKYKQHKPDFVIMNVTMPIMNGIDATKEIKTFDKDAKIIMVSGLSNYQTIRESVLAGASGFIIEMFKIDRLMDIFQNNGTTNAESSDEKAAKKRTKTLPDMTAFKKQLQKDSDNMENTTKRRTVNTSRENVAKEKSSKATSYWGEDIKQLDTKSPKSLIEEQSRELKNITNGKVIALLAGTKKEVSGGADFKYELNITSPKVSSYIYNVFLVAYHINMYPCKFYINEEIAKSLNIDSEIIAQNEKDVSNVLKKVLQSDRIKFIISSLMRMSEE